MSKKVFTFISAIVTGVAAISVAAVTFFNPNFAEAINASIPIAEGAIIGILSNFVKE